MSSRPKACAHCGAPAVETFTLRMCAEGRRKRSVHLCDACDVALSSLVLEFVRTPDLERVVAAYAARSRT